MSSPSDKPYNGDHDLDNDDVNGNKSNSADDADASQQTCAQRMVSAIRNSDTLRGGLPFFMRIALMRCAFVVIRLMAKIHVLKNALCLPGKRKNSEEYTLRLWCRSYAFLLKLLYPSLNG